MFKGIHKNRIFMIILLITLVFQIIIVEFGSVVFTVQGLNWSNWLISIALGSGSLIVGLLIRLFVPEIHINPVLLGGNIKYEDLNRTPDDVEAGMVNESVREENEASSVRGDTVKKS